MMVDSRFADYRRGPRPTGAIRCRSLCSTCGLRELCLPCGLDTARLQAMDEIVSELRRVRSGEKLHAIGDRFEVLYAVRRGMFKSRVVLRDGRDQIMGFHMPGEILGLDGIGTGMHTSEAIALEECDVCVIPYGRLRGTHVHRQLLKVMGRELARGHAVMAVLGTLRAEERLADFLVGLSRRFEQRGHSATEFHLRMRRREIASHLGLSLETVCRVFTHLQELGLIEVGRSTS